MDHCDAQLSRVVMRNYVLLMLLLPERIIIGDKKAIFFSFLVLHCVYLRCLHSMRFVSQAPYLMIKYLLTNNVEILLILQLLADVLHCINVYSYSYSLCVAARKMP